MRNRTQTEIIQNMLVIAKKKVFQDKFRKEAKVSPQMFKIYELGLLKSGRIEKYRYENKIMYRTTKKGEKTIKALIRMHTAQNNILRSMDIKRNT